MPLANLFFRSDAVLSSCGLYRYRLTRTWDDTLPVAYWVMLNPSTADATEDDPTIRRCLGFARRWGCGGIDVRNLFAFRATDPKALRMVADPVGPDNDAHHLTALVSRHLGPVIAAWGDGGALLGRARRVRELWRNWGLRAECLGFTKSGQPKHPVRLANATQRIPLEAKA